VLRSRWPNIPEQRMVELCCDWAERAGHRALVVFDRRAPGALVGEREIAAHCELVGTGPESADDWIARRAGELARAGQTYWLVTSDRELRGRAGAHAERVIGGGSFASHLVG
jgi:hypothetical protein